MSHSKERKEKNCLNCGAEVTGRYCQVCGQENTEPKETAWAIVSHFFNDITHFDGKFFSTVKLLITKPGFLSAEYLKGRRTSYLHPIRMYVFSSAFFFIIFFSLFNPENYAGVKDAEEQLTELTDASKSLKEKLPVLKDTALKAATLRSINHIDAHAALLEKEIAEKKEDHSVKEVKATMPADTTHKNVKTNTDSNDKFIDSLSEKNVIIANPVFKITNRADYNSVLAYDSVQKELPAGKRAGWIESAMMRKSIRINGKFGGHKNEGQALFMEKYLHTLPQALFVSLPLFALVLLMLYSGKNFYYADHGIFAIHLYCAAFLFLVVFFCIDKLEETSGWQWLGIPEFLVMLGLFFYLYKAMRTFYGQARGKTMLKFIILNIFSFFIVIILIVVFLLLSLIRFS